MSGPLALPPLIGCAVALCSLLLGLHTLRRRALPPLLAPLMRLNGALTAAVARDDVARRLEDLRTPADSARLYGWALVYAGTFGVIVAGGQLLRLACL
ncbi:MAG TPA: hypothetical protein PLJ35_15890 [Anaerolineae bacterium]|nr:hypothetical protein [Anaerolineae bacterium]HOG45507.1 hypothetical protein [Anaerolineae bacterium]HOR00293.1 hypothetical protein [Anaerolineae bacterium]HPL27060.1 hypothetical protein [Anaerolineae bacterium]